MHAFQPANTLTDKTLSVPLLGNSRDRFNAFSSIFFYVHMNTYYAKHLSIRLHAFVGG